ncbi:hypothetical protein Tco_0243210, partial [Tanacetum coccineum]
VAVEFIVETSLDCFGYFIFILDQGLDVVDGLDGTERGYQRLGLGEISSAIRPRDQDDPHDDAHPKGENNTKRQKTSEHGTYIFRESSSGQANESELGPSRSGDEHQYHIDQMQNFLKNDIVWESKKEILVSPFPQKPTPVVQSCQRDPKAPALSLVNQDLLYLKKGNSGPKKIVLSLHKFPAVIFPGDEIEERTSRWVDKCVKKFNLLLNKNDIEDMYLLIVNGKVDGYVETRLMWLLSVFIRSTMIWERVHDPVYGIIYKNSKKENRVMRHQEIHKLCDSTLKRVLERLKSYNNNVKHGYVTPSPSKEDVEYLQLFEEEIEEAS